MFRREWAARLQGSLDHVHPVAAQYIHSLVCWPWSSSTWVVGVKGLPQGHLSNGNEGGAGAVFSHPPPKFYPAGPGSWTSDLTSSLRYPLGHHMLPQKLSLTDTCCHLGCSIESSALPSCALCFRDTAEAPYFSLLHPHLHVREGYFIINCAFLQ